MTGMRVLILSITFWRQHEVQMESMGRGGVEKNNLVCMMNWVTATTLQFLAVLGRYTTFYDAPVSH